MHLELRTVSCIRYEQSKNCHPYSQNKQIVNIATKTPKEASVQSRRTRMHGLSDGGEP